MASGWDSEIWQPLIAAQLGVGERADAILPAIAPNPDPGSAFGLAFAMPLLWVTRRLGRHRRDRTVRAQCGFPIAQRMVLAVTNDRLLVWSASRRWKPASYLGEVSRDRVVQANAPTVGMGWRTVVIELHDAEPVVIKVGARHADPLSALLSAR